METQVSGFMKILGFIPARGGSKQVPGKNIKPLGGIPLLGRTIQVAKAANCLDRLWVSTDSEAIAKVSREYGVEVPWLRPDKLATDKAQMADVLLHLLGRLENDEGYSPDAIMVLQPTSPFRRVETIRKATQLFNQKALDTIVSVTPVRNHPYWCYRIDEHSGFLKPFTQDMEIPPPRQEFPEAYFLDGSIFLISRDEFMKTKAFHGQKCHPLIVSPEEALDIDTPFDWKLAEGLWALNKELFLA